MTDYTLTLDNFDVLNGTEGADLFTVGPNISRLASTDVMNGGSGTDVLRFTGSSISAGASKFAGLRSIEVIDLTAATEAASIALDDLAVKQAGGVLTLSYGSNAMTLDTAAVGNTGAVLLSGSGLVTLKSSAGQRASIADGAGGRVAGGSSSDAISGGSGADAITGGEGNDVLAGGAGADTLGGGDGNDLLDGGSGADTLDGGAGHDLLIVGSGDVASGGTGFDTFEVMSGNALTIADFDVSSSLERIDLRAMRAIESFSDLTLTDEVGGVRLTGAGLSLTLRNVSAAQLGADNFVFDGQTTETLAHALTVVPLARTTAGVDHLVGTAASNTFEVTSYATNLTFEDTLDGGLGYDTVRFASTSLGLTALRLDGLISIERLDVSQATTKLEIVLDADTVRQADGSALTIAFGNAALSLDASEVGSTGDVILAGTGDVLLRNASNTVSVADGYDLKITGSDAADTIHGGSGDEVFFGNNGADALSGGAGNDRLDGGLGADRLDGGSGNDVLLGGKGNDRISTGSGIDTATGGEGSDIFTVGAGNSTTIVDFEASIHTERVDLREIAGATTFAELSIDATADGANVSVGGTAFLLKGVAVEDISADNFIFSGQSDPTIIHVEAGTSQAIIQRLINEADAGTTIQLGEGTFEFDRTLLIERSDISLKGAGDDKTIIRSLIDDANAASTIIVDSSEFRERAAQVTVTALKGETSVQLSSTSSLKVGDVLYLGQNNDAAYLAATGNTGLVLPEDYDAAPGSYNLREALLKIVAIDGNTVSLSHPVPYTFEAGAAYAAISEPLRNVHLSGFRVETTFGKADPLSFTNTREAWTGIAAITLDGVTESSISDVAVYNAGSHAFRFQRVYGITGENLHAEGSQNKGGDSNGYGFLLREAFANTFTGLSDKDMRHGVLFSAFDAEHYNNIEVTSTNRDINFHGSADSGNIIRVEHSEQYYDSKAAWKPVGPGSFPMHPKSTIEDNDVRFKFLRSTELSETVHGVDDGADIDAKGGDDTVYGGAGKDTLAGNTGNDLIYGRAGNDFLSGGDGRDRLQGDEGRDTLLGGLGSDILDGGADADVLDGGDGDDILFLRSGDAATGGIGSDTFVVLGSGVIADLDAVNGFETIDLRGMSAAKTFASLTFAQDGADTRVTFGQFELRLKNVDVGSLSAQNFIFAGDTRKTLAELHTKPADAFLSSGLNALTGTAGDDVFETSVNQLSADDTVAGGSGRDTMRFTSASISLTTARLAGVSSVEILDVSLATGVVSIALDSETVNRADGDTMVVLGGIRNITLDLSMLAPIGDKPAGKVIVETFGDVTLRNSVSNTLTVSDVVRGRILGGTGNDSITGGALADLLNGGAGNDMLDGRGGTDTLVGGTGDDVYVVDSAADIVTEFSGQGTDRIVASFSTTLVANVEALTLTGSGSINGTGNELANSITGTTGNNVIDGKGGADTMSGGLGNDTYIVDNAKDVVNEQVGQGSDTVKASVSYTLGSSSSVEMLRTTNDAGTAAINLTGNALDNKIAGNAGANILDGGSGGADVLAGYGGNDKYYVNGADDVVHESASKGTDIVYSSASWTLLAGSAVEEIRTTSDSGLSSINLTGNDLANRIAGNAGVNVLTGEGGDDTLASYGGNDRLIGGLGADTLYGGGGNDVFVFTSVADSGITASTRDRIQDFTTGDRIDVSAIDANASAGGNQAFVLDTNASFSIGEIRQTSSGSSMLLEFNTDSDAAAEFSVLVVNHGLFGSGDFVL